MSSFDGLEAAAEAFVFAHDPESRESWFDEGDREMLELERVTALATAAVCVAEPVPVRLQERLAAAGLAFCAERAAAMARPAAMQPHSTPAVHVTAQRSPWSRAPSLFLLGIAATALVWFALAFSGREPRASEQRLALLSRPDVVRLEWKAGPSPKSGKVSGDVVWDEAGQRGFLTFKNLPPLDDEHCFQLWIVDGDREGAPVDGGLFAIDDATRESVVPVSPKLPVGKAAAFVVTVEDKVGAVVSKQEHVVAIAAR